jgi:hypothetical protein
MQLLFKKDFRDKQIPSTDSVERGFVKNAKGDEIEVPLDKADFVKLVKVSSKKWITGEKQWQEWVNKNVDLIVSKEWFEQNPNTSEIIKEWKLLKSQLPKTDLGKEFPHLCKLYENRISTQAFARRDWANEISKHCKYKMLDTPNSFPKSTYEKVQILLGVQTISYQFK